MENKKPNSLKLSLFKYLGLFVIVFCLSLPIMSKECMASGKTYSVKVSTGYLALRTAKSYDAANEIGKLYTGDTVEVSDTSGSTYWYVYSPKHKKSGYVNKNYLTAVSSSFDLTFPVWNVSVKKGYLALRTDKKYDAANEIGELYTGDTINVVDDTDSTYWYVYSPKYNKYGYVNKNYLTAESTDSSDCSFPTWNVSVKKGYLALRTAKKYDAANEIGELYNGDTVDVADDTDSTYWYVYSPKYNKYGYVNKNYLYKKEENKPKAETKNVRVLKGYLALRTAKKYDASNEIGKLYTGDTVDVYNTDDSTYWYVYSPKHKKYGYVNKNYVFSD